MLLATQDESGCRNGTERGGMSAYASPIIPSVCRAANTAVLRQMKQARTKPSRLSISIEKGESVQNPTVGDPVLESRCLVWAFEFLSIIRITWLVLVQPSPVCPRSAQSPSARTAQSSYVSQGSSRSISSRPFAPILTASSAVGAR